MYVGLCVRVCMFDCVCVCDCVICGCLHVSVVCVFVSRCGK